MNKSISIYLIVVELYGEMMLLTTCSSRKNVGVQYYNMKTNMNIFFTFDIIIILNLIDSDNFLTKGYLFFYCSKLKTFA